MENILGGPCTHFDFYRWFCHRPFFQMWWERVLGSASGETLVGFAHDFACRTDLQQLVFGMSSILYGLSVFASSSQGGHGPEGPMGSIHRSDRSPGDPCMRQAGACGDPAGSRPWFTTPGTVPCPSGGGNAAWTRLGAPCPSGNPVGDPPQGSRQRAMNHRQYVTGKKACCIIINT